MKKHRPMRSDIRRMVTLWLRENNICTRCMGRLTDGVFNNCDVCRDKRSLFVDTRRDKK